MKKIKFHLLAHQRNNGEYILMRTTHTKLSLMTLKTKINLQFI